MVNVIISYIADLFITTIAYKKNLFEYGYSHIGRVFVLKILVKEQIPPPQNRH